MDVDFSPALRNFALEQQQAEQAQRENAQTSQNSESATQSSQANSTTNQQGTENANAFEQPADNQDDRQEQVERAVSDLQEFVQVQNRNLDFSFDESSRRSVVQVTDGESGDVIRQIPSEEILQLSQRIRDLQDDVGAAVGILFNREV